MDVRVSCSIYTQPHVRLGGKMGHDPLNKPSSMSKYIVYCVTLCTYTRREKILNLCVLLILIYEAIVHHIHFTILIISK